MSFKLDYLYSLKVILRCHKSGGIPAEIFIVISDVKSETEEDVVPDEHLHFRILSRINSHDIPVNNRDRPAGRRRNEITVDFENGALSQ